MTTTDLFKPGENCWKTSTANFAAPVIDCANFYRALHESISKAKHSIFILGWDIDSRIDLLRGEEAERSELPVNISELLAHVCQQNPELQVYLLRWDPSISFFSLRETWMQEAWEEKTAENVHIWLDDSVPVGGCQHQKVIVIDDELAFSGGMDVTVRRWDTREHKVIEPEREDEGGEYGPFHDVQSVVSGPVVDIFSELVRWRWNQVASTEAIGHAPVEHDSNNPPKTWPSSVEPCLKAIDCAVARTLPDMEDGENPVCEVKHMLEDLIEAAEEFVYIENQFATHLEFAEQLNAQMKRHPELNVLFLSSYKPESLMEKEVYWATRIDFKDMLGDGVEKKRQRMVYSAAIDADGNFGAKRIHAKVMAIDDRYLVIGSSNLSNRSMTLDSECDLIFAATTQEHRAAIAHIRNDLIAEHVGKNVEDVEKTVKKYKKPINALLKPKSKHAYSMQEMDDEKFTDQSLKDILTPISDPDEPMISPVNVTEDLKIKFTNPSRRAIVLTAVFLGVVALITGLWFASQHISWLQPENINTFLEQLRGTVWALPAVVGLYLIAGILFFPVTVLSIAVAAVFGPVWGPAYGMVGVVMSSALLFSIGQMIGDRGLRKLGGHKVQKVDERIQDSGVIGVAAIRLIPIAPFSLVNLVAGISSLHISTFLLGTFMGMLPTMIAKGLVGDSITQILKNPSALTISYMVGGIAIWVAAIFISQKAVKYFQNKKEDNAENTEHAQTA